MVKRYHWSHGWSGLARLHLKIGKKGPPSSRAKGKKSFN